MIVSRKEAKAAFIARIYENTVLKVQECGDTAKAFEVMTAKHEKTVNAMRLIYYRGGGNHFKRHGHSIMTREPEDVIKGFLLAFSAVNMPLTLPHLSTVFETYLHRRVCPSTITRWLESWSDVIRKRKTKSLGHKRINPAIVDQVDTFCLCLEEAVKTKKMFAHNCVNYDETRIALQFWASSPGTD